VTPIKNRHETSARGAGDDALVDFAADLGRFLGTVQNRAAGWLEQRKTIADQLTQIRDTANEYLRQLTGTEPAIRRGRPAGTKTAGTARGRKKRTMSPEARERIAEAQRRRWAKHRKAKAAGNA
jgi:hypothetical protein